MIELWKGSCNQWDCDEMGHMNVRIYVEKQVEAVAALADVIGLRGSFSSRAAATLRPSDQHIRFIAEVLPGKPLSLWGGVLDLGISDARLYQELRHADGRIAAAFRTHIEHVDTAEGEAFPWPKRARAALDALKITAPAETRPRSIADTMTARSLDALTYEEIRRIGAPMIGKGVVMPQHTDTLGLMAPGWFIGRISDSVPNLLHDWRRRVADQAGGRRIGAAVLEYRLRYHRWPVAGDAFEAFSSLGATESKTHTLVHWMMDPASRLPWASMQATAITLDLDLRKAVPADPEMLRELERIAPRGLSL